VYKIRKKNHNKTENEVMSVFEGFDILEYFESIAKKSYQTSA